MYTARKGNITSAQAHELAQWSHMHTVLKGDLSVAMLIAKFLRSGFVVLKPMSELSRYDLVIDRGGGFERVQCKTGRLRGGVIKFKACSAVRNERHSYRGQVELFGVYCPENDQCYLVSVDAVGTAEGVLRVEAPRNKQKAGVRAASEFLV